MVRVSVWCEPVSGIVVGYYAIVPTNVAPGGLTRKVRGGYSGPIPGYLIAKLALSRDLHGGGYGADLLLDALEAVAAAANLAGGRLVVVDAIDEKAFGFYEHCGLTPIGDSERLFARIDEISESLALAQYGLPPADTKAAAAGFRWATSGTPDYLMLLQIEPVAHTPRSSSRPKDAVADMFGALGFRSIAEESDALASASPDIHCRIDSPHHATIVIRLDERAAVDVPIPHDRPDLSARLSDDRVARIYATTDSIVQDGLIDRDMLARDIAAGSVMAATVAVVRS